MADYNIDISMVKSELHPNKINYNESKQIDEEDIGMIVDSFKIYID